MKSLLCCIIDGCFNDLKIFTKIFEYSKTRSNNEKETYFSSCWCSNAFEFSTLKKFNFIVTGNFLSNVFNKNLLFYTLMFEVHLFRLACKNRHIHRYGLLYQFYQICGHMIHNLLVVHNK
jgi:hypothetical protein